ncbi:MAG: hypothetical protein HQM12_14320 [SAR324 cluster bacterium]|nr:hypothetical protein [SAR324 cluster bacterium]
MNYNPHESWYVMRIRTKFNQQVERALKNKQFHIFNPTYQEWSQRKDRKKLLTKPIFNGYMFVQTLLNPETHLELLKTLGVIELLKTSQSVLTVPQNEIDNLRLLENYIGQCVQSPQFAVGDRVRITQGLLKGLVGCVDRINKKILRISVDSVPGSIAIEINPDHVEPLEQDSVYLTIVQ